VHVHLEGDPAASEGIFERRLVDGRSRVVHEDVDAAVEECERTGDDLRAAFGVGEVGGDGLGARAVTAAARERLVEAAREVVVRLDGARDERQARALRREALGPVTTALRPRKRSGTALSSLAFGLFAPLAL
jgi:hypothetical protein